MTIELRKLRWKWLNHSYFEDNRMACPEMAIELQDGDFECFKQKMG